MLRDAWEAGGLAAVEAEMQRPAMRSSDAAVHGAAESRSTRPVMTRAPVGGTARVYASGFAKSPYVDIAPGRRAIARHTTAQAVALESRELRRMTRQWRPSHCTSHTWVFGGITPSPGGQRAVTTAPTLAVSASRQHRSTPCLETAEDSPCPATCAWLCHAVRPSPHCSPARSRLLSAVTTLPSAGLSRCAPHPVVRCADRASRRYHPQRTCAPHAQPGVVRFRKLILATYRGTGDDGIVRACHIGGRSEHKEGRAWDWAVSVHNARQVGQVTTCSTGCSARCPRPRYAMARRLGIMYIIWNKKIWGTYSASSRLAALLLLRCHRLPPNHVHFSFSWRGERARPRSGTGSRTPVRPATGAG